LRSGSLQRRLAENTYTEFDGLKDFDALDVIIERHGRPLEIYIIARIAGMKHP